MAIELGIETKVKPILFTAIQEKKSIHILEDIKMAFIQFGINETEYDIVWNNKSVKSLVLHQEQSAIQI